MKKFSTFILIIIFFNLDLFAMEKKPYHHLLDGTFRNPEGSPQRDSKVKYSCFGLIYANQNTEFRITYKL